MESYIKLNTQPAGGTHLAVHTFKHRNTLMTKATAVTRTQEEVMTSTTCNLFGGFSKTIGEPVPCSRATKKAVSTAHQAARKWIVDNLASIEADIAKHGVI